MCEAQVTSDKQIVMQTRIKTCANSHCAHVLSLILVVMMFMHDLWSSPFFFRVQGGGDQNADPPPRPGSQIDQHTQQGMSSSTSGTAFQGKSKTTSAPTSPLKEKKSSFFGKVSKVARYAYEDVASVAECSQSQFFDTAKQKQKAYVENGATTHFPIF